MGWRGVVRRLPLAGAGAVGAAVGHSVAYLIVAPHGRTRAALLAGTGHGYWSTAVAAEIVIGLLVVVSMIAGRVRDGLRQAPRAAPDVAWVWLALRLGLLQTSIFTVQEVLERTVSGHPVSLVAGDRLVVVGVLVQVLVAAVAAAVLGWLGRAAEAVGRALAAGPPPPWPAGLVVPWPARVVRRVWRPRGALGSRAPPRLQMA
jgi:hypothetical protein